MLPGNPLAGSLYQPFSLYRVLNFELSVNEELVVPPGLPDFIICLGKFVLSFALDWENPSLGVILTHKAWTSGCYMSV